MRPIIKLVRHGQSRANTGEVSAQEVGDHTISLTEKGGEQARAAGHAIGREFLTDALVFVSPYRRTRETLAGVLAGAGFTDADRPRFPTYEDPRLREVDHGYDDVDAQQDLRATHGRFYYRYQRGESPADCFDRVSGFIDSMWRQIERKPEARNVLVVSHGLTVRCFVMRFLHLKVEDFERMRNPDNASIVTLEPRTVGDYVFSTTSWGVTGLELY